MPESAARVSGTLKKVKPLKVSPPSSHLEFGLEGGGRLYVCGLKPATRSLQRVCRHSSMADNRSGRDGWPAAHESGMRVGLPSRRAGRLVLEGDVVRLLGR